MPLTVTAYVPAGVLVDVVMVRVDDPPEVTVDGLNEALAPAGRPPAERLTDWAEPLVVVVATVALTEPPGAVEPEVGDTEREKSAACCR